MSDTHRVWVQISKIEDSFMEPAYRLVTLKMPHDEQVDRLRPGTTVVVEFTVFSLVPDS